MRISIAMGLVTVMAVLGLAQPAAAQVIGTFRWQLLPYCNVVTFTITQQGPQYLLDGSDDQCGAGTATARGLAFLNANGTIGFGFTILTTPGAQPVHVDATLNPPSFGGTWRDSDGHTGPVLFLVGAPAIGSPRPAASAGAGPFRAVVLPPTVITTDPNPANSPDLAPISFTAPFTGVAVASGTGYCLLNSSSAGPSGGGITVAVNGAIPAGGLLLSYLSPFSMPQSNTALSEAKPWSVQREFAVTAGTTYTASVKALRTTSIAPVVTCSGNLHLRVHAGTLQ